MRKATLSIAVLLSFLLTISGHCQKSTDHFRSKQTGRWGLASTWESSSDSINWINATVFPDEMSSSIIIQTSHVISQWNTGLKIDQITVMHDAILEIASVTTLMDGPGDDLSVYGTLHVFSILSKAPSANIVIKDGGNYLADISSNDNIHNCIWETGSTLELNNFSNKSSITGMSQSFHHILWNGSTQTTDVSLNLTNGFQANGSFLVQSTNNKYIILSSSNEPRDWLINGNLELHEISSMKLSDGTGPIKITINGDLIIGNSPNLLSRLVMGTATNAGNVIDLSGNLIVNSSGGINHNSNVMNGTICFVNTSDIQNIQNPYDRIFKINFILNEGVSVSSSNWRVDPTYQLTLKNNASLITNSDVPVSIERTLVNADWAVAMDGWHLISSPVSGQSVGTGGFTFPIGDPHYNAYDFYGWNWSTNDWLNQKVAGNDITTFILGTGYLVAYDDGGTKTFSGILNNESITLSNLSYSGTGSYGGFHLLGNPFPSAINWNDSQWLRNDVSNVAFVWNETAENYLPVTEINPIIAAQQGFFVRALSTNNSIVIPETARVHSSISFNKEYNPLISTSGTLYLRVTSHCDSTFDETIVRLHQESLSGYDANDGSKLTGSPRAPQLYTMIEPDDKASVNVFSRFDPPETVPLFFKPGSMDSYSLEVILNSMEENVFLEDIITGQITKLSTGTNFSFNASPQDDLNRFLIHLGPLAVEETEKESLTIYSDGRNIIIYPASSSSPLSEPLHYTLLTLSGRVLLQGRLEGSLPAAVDLPPLPPSVYLLSLKSSNLGVLSKKIVIF